MGVLRFKLLRDLWHHNKVRTLQVVLIIASGAASLGMITGVRNMVIPRMLDIWRGLNQPAVTFSLYPGVEEDDLYTLRRDPEVADLEPVRVAQVEWRLGEAEEWQQAGLVARQDYDDLRLDKLELVAGDWPHGQTLAITPESETIFKVPSDGTIQVRAGHKVYTARTGGQVYDPTANTAAFGGTAQFYASPEFFETLVDETRYNRLLVASAFEYDEHKTLDLANRLDERLERMGNQTSRTFSEDANRFFEDSMSGVFFIMGVLAAVSLGLGLLLVYNTINSIILAQVNQIGVMKAIGARSIQIIAYFSQLVLVYGLLSLAIALPLGMLGAWGLTAWLINSILGANAGQFAVNAQAVMVSISVALVAPLISALAPIWSASRTTVREAISTFGLSTKVALIDRMMNSLRWLSRLALLAISNTFRHKGRVLFLQTALVLSGLVFMMVIGVRDSVVYTMRDVLLEILDVNVTMVLKRSQPIDYIEKLVRSYPGTTAVESWALANVTARPQGQAYSKNDEDLLALGVPLPTGLYDYQLLSGRWLAPGDQDALVINARQARQMGVEVGDWLTIRYNEKSERDYRIVGMIFDPVLTNTVLVWREPMLHALGSVRRTSIVSIQTAGEGAEYETAYARGLRRYLEANFVQVSTQRGMLGNGESKSEVASMLIDPFNFLIVLLGVMAVVIGAVGSIALSGGLALSVMERRREIGVMRAIGARSWPIFRLFISEGLILGWLSWLLALPAASSASKLMVQMLGQAINLDLRYHFTLAGPLTWLVIITVLSVSASLLPARGATRISVRESLAYQ